MRNYKLTIMYDGSKYRGWQRQVHTNDTIQWIIEDRMGQMLGYPVEIQAAGRTDGGVHALAQSATVKVAKKLEEAEFLMELNQKLPDDIQVQRLELVSQGFHARYAARGKCYEYQIDTREKPSVFTRRWTYHYTKHLDIEKMKQAAEKLIGSHDFAGFTSGKYEGKSTSRNIYKIEIEKEKSILFIRYYGNGFLYHMVRILTGTLLEIGSAEKKPDVILQVLSRKNREDAGFLAPARGLFLKEVYYEESVK